MSKLSLIHSTQQAGPNTEIYGPRSEYGFLRTARRPIRMQDSSKPYNIQTRRLHRRSLRLPTRRKWAQSGYLCNYAVYGSRRGRCRNFLVLNWGGGLNLQIWDLNRAHETERTVFPILQVFSMCRRKL